MFMIWIKPDCVPDAAKATDGLISGPFGSTPTFRVSTDPHLLSQRVRRALSPYVEEITWQTTIEGASLPAVGIYEKEGSRMTVDHQWKTIRQSNPAGNDKPPVEVEVRKAEVSVTAPTIEAALQLYDRVRSGMKPTTAYTGPEAERKE